MARLYILALSSVHGTASCIIGQDSDINPGGGVPVGIVVPLLRTLIATPITILVLSSKASILSPNVLKVIIIIIIIIKTIF